MLSYKCTTECPVRTGEVQFGLLSNTEARKMSTVQIDAYCAARADEMSRSAKATPGTSS